jgi:hypothetical protein
MAAFAKSWAAGMNESAPPTGKLGGLSNRGGRRLLPPHAASLHRFRWRTTAGLRLARTEGVGVSQSLAPAKRRSVAVAAPIEPVVDPSLDHLNVAVAPGKGVAGEEWGASRNNKRPCRRAA